MSYRVLVLGALGLSVACRSSPNPGGPAHTAVGSTTEPAAAAAPERTPREPDDPRPRLEHDEHCAEPNTRIAEAGLCLRLPDGYAVRRSDDGVRVFDAQGLAPITVRWLPATSAFARTHAEAVSQLSRLDPEARTGSTRGGDGAFVYAEETQPQGHRVAHAASSLHTARHQVWCTASDVVGQPGARAFFEACQTLMSSD